MPRVIEVIESRSEKLGFGTPDDPYFTITEYYDKDGSFIGYHWREVEDTIKYPSNPVYGLIEIIKAEGDKASRPLHKKEGIAWWIYKEQAMRGFKFNLMANDYRMAIIESEDNALKFSEAFDIPIRYKTEGGD